MNVDGSDQHQVFVPICVSPHGVSRRLRRRVPGHLSELVTGRTRIAFVREGSLARFRDLDHERRRERRAQPAHVGRTAVSYTAWSPDGTQIAYPTTTCVAPYTSCSRRRMEAPCPRSLSSIGPLNPVDSSTFDIAPSWSPNGAADRVRGRLAFNGPVGIWVATVGGGRASAVHWTKAPALHRTRPTDAASRSSAREIWTMNADGSNQVRLGAETTELGTKDVGREARRSRPWAGQPNVSGPGEGLAGRVRGNEEDRRRLYREELRRGRAAGGPTRPPKFGLPEPTGGGEHACEALRRVGERDEVEAGAETRRVRRSLEELIALAVHAERVRVRRVGHMMVGPLDVARQDRGVGDRGTSRNASLPRSITSVVPGTGHPTTATLLRPATRSSAAPVSLSRPTSRS